MVSFEKSPKQGVRVAEMNIITEVSLVSEEIIILFSPELQDSVKALKST